MHALIADENVARRVYERLREDGFDILHSTIDDVLRKGVPDEEQLEKAAELGRVLVTCDIISFVRLVQERREAGRHHAGIVFVQAEDHWAEQARRIREVLEANGDQDLQGVSLFA